MVPPGGFEPSTNWLRVSCSTDWATEAWTIERQTYIISPFCSIIKFFRKKVACCRFFSINPNVGTNLVPNTDFTRTGHGRDTDFTRTLHGLYTDSWSSNRDVGISLKGRDIIPVQKSCVAKPALRNCVGGIQRRRRGTMSNRFSGFY